MTMHSVVVCLPSDAEHRIIADLELYGHRVMSVAQNPNEAEAAVRSGDAEWAVIGAGPRHLSPRLLNTCDRAGVRMVALAVSDAERRYAADLGVREVLDAGVGWEQIEELLSTRGAGAAEKPVPAAAASPGQGPGERVGAETGTEVRRGEVITVWGPAGAPGRTTVAIAIASELAAEGFTVALADADTHSGAIAPSLGMLDEAPGFAAACRLASTESLTTSELERISERYSSPHGSFWVLTGIGRPHRWPELSGARVASSLNACRSWVDYTVVDTGFSLENDEEISSDLLAPQRNAATITALREADRIIAVGAGDPVGLSRFLRAHVDLLELVDAERVLTIINRIRGSVIGPSPTAQVEQTLLRFGGIIASALIPHDQTALDAAILSGKTLADVAGKSGPRVALRTLVTSHLVPAPAASGKGRTLRSRIEAAHARTRNR